MKTNSKTIQSTLLAATLALAAYLPPAARAADHGDAPTVAHDQGSDIADLYFFRDPTAANNTATDPLVVLIATLHGFIVPGEAVNFAIFDPVVRYRFEIYNDHVNLDPKQKDFLARVKPNKFIDVTFTQRVGIVDPNHASNKDILQIPARQMATVQFTGFTGINPQTKFTADVTNPSLALSGTTASSSAPSALVTDLKDPATQAPIGVHFFAGERDDPFFFDIPGFAGFISSIRTTGTANVGALNRGRDSFAGYNVLSIALRLPASMLTGTNGKKIGLDFLTQRHNTQVPLRNGEISGRGIFRTIDREGVPAVNVALVPFSRKNEYNASSVHDDVAGKFAGDVVATLTALGTNSTFIGILAGVAVTFGDILTLDPTIVNSGPGGGDNQLNVIGGPGFPNGRRLKDDVIDILLTLIANGTPLSDNVDANDVPFTDSFPYLAPSQQPRGSGVIDDNTRN